MAVGTYNINGGKHFRSVVYKDVSLDDWLLDSWRESKDGENHEDVVPLVSLVSFRSCELRQKLGR